MNRNVLVISNNCFSSSSNNGKTFESIFTGLEKTNISQLYFTDDIQPDFNFCDKYFRIRDKDVLFNIISIKKRHGGQVHPQMYLDFQPKLTKKSVSYENLKSVLRFIRDLLWSFNGWKTDDLKRWSIDQHLDFIFFIGGGSKFSHDVALFLSEFLKIDLIVFFTDDYILYPKKRTFFDYIQNYRMKKCYHKTISRASLCFGIGEMMCETYSAYFGKDFYPIMNSVHIDMYKAKTSINHTIRACYFGSLHTNRWKMIIKLANYLEMMNFKNMEINVYSDGLPHIEVLKLFSNVGVKYNGGVYGNKLREALLDSDILLHVESDDEDSKAKTKLSFSTKIPEYLASGRMILGFGPKDIASMKFLIDNKLGIVISPKDNVDQTRETLSNLISNHTYREYLGKSAYEFATRKFDNKKITMDFYAKIEAIIKKRENKNQ